MIRKEDRHDDPGILLTIAVGAGTRRGARVVLALNLPPLPIWPSGRPIPGWRRALMLWLFRGYCPRHDRGRGAVRRDPRLGAWPPAYAIGAPIMLGDYALSLWAYKALRGENTYFGSDGSCHRRCLPLLAQSPLCGAVAGLRAGAGGGWRVEPVGAGVRAGHVRDLLPFRAERGTQPDPTGTGAPSATTRCRTPRFIDRRRLRALAEGRGGVELTPAPGQGGPHRCPPVDAAPFDQSFRFGYDLLLAAHHAGD